MTELTFVGPFLTRAQAAHRAGISRRAVALRPDLLRLRGIWLEETYFDFQFLDHGIRPDLARLVQSLKTRFDDETIADWLAHPGAAPLDR